ncbi:unnamed protein product [Onchocerca flexuosa]|uniref:Cytochrome-c oxidase n=1 Tax=Onchocerca flexuosa TaxID=387005 RepID=A0A183I313_9BILA|nr:unnamed protein product [Onchocerca flexuosa]
MWSVGGVSGDCGEAVVESLFGYDWIIVGLLLSYCWVVVGSLFGYHYRTMSLFERRVGGTFIFMNSVTGLRGIL